MFYLYAVINIHTLFKKSLLLVFIVIALVLAETWTFANTQIFLKIFSVSCYTSGSSVLIFFFGFVFSFRDMLFDRSVQIRVLIVMVNI